MYLHKEQIKKNSQVHLGVFFMKLFLLSFHHYFTTFPFSKALKGAPFSCSFSSRKMRKVFL